MRYGLLAGVLLLVASSVSAQTIQVHGHPQITQYDSPADWPFVDQQAWWRHPPDPAKAGTLENDAHIHMGCRAPIYGVIDRPVDITCTVVMFQFPGFIFRLNGRGDPGSPFDGPDARDIPLETRTGDPAGLVSFDVRYTISPSNFKMGGAQVALFKPWGRFVDHNGLERAQSPTLRLPFFVVNGHPEEPAGPCWGVSGNAYMTGQPPTAGREPFDYSIIKCLGPVPIAPIMAPFAVTGTWNPHPKSIYDRPPYEAAIHYDPGFHSSHNGEVQWSVTSSDGQKHTHVIDPATLTPGPHTVMFRSMIEHAPTGELQAGVTVVAIRVGESGGTTPPPPPPPPVTIYDVTADGQLIANDVLAPAAVEAVSEAISDAETITVERVDP